MSRCLELARLGAGYVSPNPLVGAVVVSEEGLVLGEGWHGRYGGPHAEVWAIRDALRRHDPEALKRATLYVNLEPCSHVGKTPPCSDLIVETGIPGVVVGMIDPFPRVSGRGIRRLEAAGVRVKVGVLGHESRRLNEAFTHHIETSRPLVTLKVAQSLDGHVATASGASQWITGPESRALVHRWRAELDAVLVGSGTARRDDPALTVRHVEGRQPLRIVMDSRGALSPGLRLFTDEHASSTVAVVAEGTRPAYAGQLAAAKGRVLPVPCRSDGLLDLHEMFALLGQSGGRDGCPVQSVLAEAGPRLATALFRMDLVDRYFLFLAPKLLGAGIPAVGDLGIADLEQALLFAETEWERVGADLLLKAYRRALA